MPEAPVGHLDEVVEVATDRARRAVVGGDLPLRQARQLAGQELLLDEGRDAHLLFYALALGGLVRLLADELGDADGGRGLGGERREEAAIVRGVVLLREPRAQVERADQLALGDERDDQRHAGLAKGGDRRRVELETGDVDWTWRRLEVGEQRVALGDVDRDRAGRGVGGRRRLGDRFRGSGGGRGLDGRRRYDRATGGSGGSGLSYRASCWRSGVRELLRGRGAWLGGSRRRTWSGGGRCPRRREVATERGRSISSRSRSAKSVAVRSAS